MAIEKRKKNNTTLLLAGALGLLALASSSKKTTRKTTSTKPTPEDTNIVFTGENQPPQVFEENEGVISVTASDIVPFIVPSSFVITPIENKYYRWKTEDPDNPQKEYYPIAKVNFLLCIHVPKTSAGSLQIEDVDITDIQLVRYITDQQQEWIKPFEGGTSYNAYARQLQELNNAFKGKEVYTGYNLFEIEFYIGPFKSDAYTRNRQLKWPYHQYEAISLGLNIKYEETRMAHWRCLSAWNIKEDELINSGDSFGTNTRFGVVRDYTSKPREQRGLFSEWWADYLAAGYNTNIVKITANAPVQ